MLFTEKKRYNVAHLEMLLASQTICAHFIEHLDQFALLTNKWTPEFAQQLSERIQHAIHSLLAADHKKGLREASAAFKSLEDPARQAVMDLYDTIDVFLPNDKAELTRRFGYKKYWKDSKKNKQASLLGILACISHELNDKLRTKMVAAGVHEAVLDSVIDFSLKLDSAHVAHEKLKTDSRDGGKAARDEYIAIYNDIIGISKLARKRFRRDAIMRDRFVFAKVVKRIKVQVKNQNEIAEGDVVLDTTAGYSAI